MAKAEVTQVTVLTLSDEEVATLRYALRLALFTCSEARENAIDALALTISQSVND